MSVRTQIILVIISWFSSITPGNLEQILEIGHGCFLLHSFIFLIHSSLCHKELCCESYAPSNRLVPPGKFLVLISVRGWVSSQGHNAAGRIRLIEKSDDVIGNRTCALPACSIVPPARTWLMRKWVILLSSGDGCSDPSMTRSNFLANIGLYVRYTSRLGI
jgi:hypothetical protein